MGYGQEVGRFKNKMTIRLLIQVFQHLKIFQERDNRENHKVNNSRKFYEIQSFLKVFSTVLMMDSTKTHHYEHQGQTEDPVSIHRKQDKLHKKDLESVWLLTSYQQHWKLDDNGENPSKF
jgi:hypothetical protein